MKTDKNTTNVKNMLDGLFQAKKKIKKEGDKNEEKIEEKEIKKPEGEIKKKNKKAKKEKIDEGIKISTKSLEQKVKTQMHEKK